MGGAASQGHKQAPKIIHKFSRPPNTHARTPMRASGVPVMHVFQFNFVINFLVTLKNLKNHQKIRN